MSERAAELEAIVAGRPRTQLEVDLPQEQIDAFWRDGFTSVDRITTDEEVSWLGELYDALFSERHAAVAGGYFDLARPYDSPGDDLLPQILMPEQTIPELRKTTYHRNAHKLAWKLLGAEPIPGWGHMILKPPRIGEALPWHQDEAYWDPAYTYRALGAWLPLDPATLESGCMSFVPGSHAAKGSTEADTPVRVHRHVNDDPSVHALVTDDVDASRAVPVPLGAGGASFHHCRVLHSSAPNRTGRQRRAYAIEFQT